MNVWQRWVRAPQTLWLRRLLFQLHLWLGIGFCQYVLIVSISGTALLLRSPFYQWFEPKYVVPIVDAEVLTGEALQARMREVYAGFNVGFTIEGYTPDLATYVVINDGTNYFPHYFDQYRGVDLGPANPWPIKAVEWVGDIHDDLTLGRLGRQLNGAGGLLFVVMSLSGLILWWQGRARWQEALYLKRGTQRSLWWQLHAVFGFWGLILMFAWGVSGIQLGLPQLLRWMTDVPQGPQPSSSLLRFFRDVHFARFGSGDLARWSWILVSLVPTVLAVSGVVVWWRRVVLGRWLRAARTSGAAAAPTSAVPE